MSLSRSLILFLIYVPLSLHAASKTAVTKLETKQDCPRIISQSPYISEMLDYLGMEHCIVGVSRYSKRDLPRTGGILDPDADAIDSLMPDLIITSDWSKADVLKSVTPKGAKAIRLKSFNKMAQLEENMSSIIKATHWKGANKKSKELRENMA